MSQTVPEFVSCENEIHQFFLNQKIGSLLKRSNIDKERPLHNWGHQFALADDFLSSNVGYAKITS